LVDFLGKRILEFKPNLFVMNTCKRGPGKE